MLQKKLAMIASIMAVVGLSGCATIMNGGTTQAINVQAIDSETNLPISGAVCHVSTTKDQMAYVNGNPGVATVTRGGGALTVACAKKGYMQTRTASGNSFDAWTIGNVIFWPGFIVDAVSGAAVKYPSHITVVMTRNHSH